MVIPTYLLCSSIVYRILRLFDDWQFFMNVSLFWRRTAFNFEITLFFTYHVYLSFGSCVKKCIIFSPFNSSCFHHKVGIRAKITSAILQMVMLPLLEDLQHKNSFIFSSIANQPVHCCHNFFVLTFVWVCWCTHRSFWNTDWRCYYVLRYAGIIV